MAHCGPDIKFHGCLVLIYEAVTGNVLWHRPNDFDTTF